MDGRERAIGRIHFLEEKEIVDLFRRRCRGYESENDGARGDYDYLVDGPHDDHPHAKAIETGNGNGNGSNEDN